MIKKVLIGIVVLAVIVLAGWKLLFSSDDVGKAIADAKENLIAYHMEATMDIENGDETRNYFVTTDYMKEDSKDFFRVSLLDKNINQEQIILRNTDGVFVLTPLLNQVYKFKGDWPLNTPKPYLYHSMLDSFDKDHEVKTVEDGYLVSYAPNYKNAPSWAKQDMKFSKDLKPLWINIYNPNNEAVVKIVFSKADFAPTFAEDFFKVDANMANAREGMSQSTSATIDDLPLYPAGADISAVLKEQTETKINGEEVHILVYEGTQSFTIIQSIIEPTEEMVVNEIDGELVELTGGFGYVTYNYLTYVYNGVSYRIHSSNMTVAQMVDIANGMQVVVMK